MSSNASGKNKLVRIILGLLVAMGAVAGSVVLFQKYQESQRRFVADCQNFRNQLRHQMERIQLVSSLDELKLNKFKKSLVQVFGPPNVKLLNPFTNEEGKLQKGPHSCVVEYANAQTPSSIQFFTMPNSFSDSVYDSLNPQNGKGSLNELFKLGYGLRDRDMQCSLDNKEKSRIEMAAAALISRLTPDQANVKVILDAVIANDVMYLGTYDFGGGLKPQFFIEWNFPIQDSDKWGVFRMATVDEGIRNQLAMDIKAISKQAEATTATSESLLQECVDQVLGRTIVKE